MCYYTRAYKTCLNKIEKNKFIKLYMFKKKLLHNAPLFKKKYKRLNCEKNN